MDMVGTQLSEMIEAYAQLMREREADVQKWHAVHRRAPKLALTALMAVCSSADPGDLVSVIYQLTESPAMMFVRLRDGIDYDANERRAGFASDKSAAEFETRFRDWFVWVRAPLRGKCYGR